MFLAFSLLLLGWQACYADRRYAHPAYPDVYPIHRDVHPNNPAYHKYRDPRIVQFSKDFSFGVATSAYQIEGAWNKDGKGESIWDRFLHTHRLYSNGTNGDVAANAYYNIEEDIKLLKYLGVRHYKLSLSWSRLLPNGLTTNVNSKAVEHYRKQFKLLRDNQIEPFVTLYQWDLPQHLQDFAGFQNASIVSWFARYARVAFDLFGDDVKYWSTFHEPYQICVGGYGSNLLAPAVDKSGVADYICGHNLLKAHAAAWHVYDKEFRGKQKGRVSINLGLPWVEAASASKEDIAAAETQRQFFLGWFANPIYNGDYPEVMKQRVKERCGLQGLQRSRLPEFSKKDIAFIKGTHDYFSLSTHRVLRAQAIKAPLQPSLFQYDVGAKLSSKRGGNSYGIRKALVWIKEKYNNPSIWISEDGNGLRSATLDDHERITAAQKTLSSVYDAINVDDVRVYGYTRRNFMDGYEWFRGYDVYYGLVAVDFKNPKKTRKLRKSAFWYKQLCLTGCTGDKCPYSKEY